MAAARLSDELMSTVVCGDGIGRRDVGHFVRDVFSGCCVHVGDHDVRAFARQHAAPLRARCRCRRRQ